MLPHSSTNGGWTPTINTSSLFLRIEDRKPSMSLSANLPNGVVVHGSSGPAIEAFRNIVNNYANVFKDPGSVDLPEPEWMRIPLKSDCEFKVARPKSIHWAKRTVMYPMPHSMNYINKTARHGQHKPHRFHVLILSFGALAHGQCSEYDAESPYMVVGWQLSRMRSKAMHLIHLQWQPRPSCKDHHRPKAKASVWAQVKGIRQRRHWLLHLTYIRVPACLDHVTAATASRTTMGR